MEPIAHSASIAEGGFYLACVFVRHCFSSAMTANTAQLDDEISVHRADSATRGVPLLAFREVAVLFDHAVLELAGEMHTWAAVEHPWRRVSHINGRVGLTVTCLVDVIDEQQLPDALPMSAEVERLFRAAPGYRVDF